MLNWKNNRFQSLELYTSMFDYKHFKIRNDFKKYFTKGYSFDLYTFTYSIF
jgi:hypothetical protein